MLTRRSSLGLPDSTDLQLPLLVPSFSSKGSSFVPMRGNKDQISVLSSDLEYFADYSTSSVLLSAYDIHFKHFRMKRVKDVFKLLSKPRLIFIDSGGYELGLDFDSTEFKIAQYRPRDGYGRKEYEAVLDSIDRYKHSIMIANFDYSMKPVPIDKQIADARKLFRKYPGVLSDFILKPWTKGYIDVQQLSPADIQNLKDFTVVGVTEKNLGKSLWDRLQAIARLRSRLNREGVNAAIHIWGGLDPIITPLYFFAGAEIFDGVSWLRYAYVNGLAVNKHCCSVFNLDEGVKASIEISDPLRLMKNCQYLNGMGDKLRQWHSEGGVNFTMFEPDVAKYLKMAYEKMKFNIDEIGQ